MAEDISLNNKRIAKNTIFLYLRLAFALVVSLYTTRVVLSVLGQEDYGINNVVAGFVSMFSFLTASMSNGIQRFFNYERTIGGVEAAKVIYNHALLIQFLIACFILLLTETVGVWYLENKMVIPIERFYAAKWVFQLSVLSLVIVVFAVPYTAAVMSHEKMGYFALVSVVEVVLKLVLVILLQYVTADKLIFFGLFQVIISFNSLVLYVVYCRKNFSEIRLRLVFNKETFVKMFSFSGWNLLNTFSYTMKGQGVNLLLNAFFGPIVNAARGISFQILTALQGFTNNIFIAFRPQVVEAYAKKNNTRVCNLMYTMSKMSFYLLYLFSVPVILEIDYLLSCWLGDNVPNYTVPFTVLILLNTLMSNFNTPLTLVVHATGKLKKFELIASLIILSILPASWIALKCGASPVSVYWVSLGIVVVNQIVCLLVLKSIFEYSLRDYTRNVVLPSMFVFVLVPILPAIIHVYMSESLLRLLVVGLVSVLSTIVFVYLGGLNKNERQLTNSYLRKVLHKS